MNVDSDIERLKEKIDYIHQIINQPYLSDYKNLESDFKRAEDTVNMIKGEIEAANNDINKENEIVSKFEKCINRFKTSKEYENGFKNVDKAKAKIEVLMNKLNALNNRMETNKDYLNLKNNELLMMKNKIIKDTENNTKELTSLKNILNDLTLSRKSIISQFTGAFLERFNKIYSRQTDFIVLLSDDVCNGCSIRIPKQVAAAERMRLAHGVGSNLAYRNEKEAAITGQTQTKMGVATAQRNQEIADASGGFKNFADMTTAQQMSIANLWNPNDYQKFVDGTKMLELGQRDGLIKAANTLGWDLRQWGEHSSEFDAMKKSGALAAYTSGQITDGDLKLMGQMGLFTEAGQANAKEYMQTLTGMSEKERAEYMTTHEGIQGYAKFNEMEKFAQSHGHDFMDLARDSSREFNLSVGKDEAVSWGLKGAGKYRISSDGAGGILFNSSEHGTQRWDGKRFVKEDTNIYKKDHGARVRDGDEGTFGNTAQYNLGMDNISRDGFKVAGMHLIAAKISRNGEQYTIEGTNHLGYHVTMEGSSSDGIYKSKEW